ncbi:MAG: ribokinase [Thermoprotei archaeon]|nr:MAG: ribokinase [Thermoprotei archaeon]
MKRPSIVVVGTMHMDFTVYVDHLPKPGETVLGRDFEMSPGGKGANQAVAISRLGGVSYLISRVGEDYIGDLLLDNARRNGVRVDFVKKDPDVHSGVALIFVDKSGENMIAVAPGVDSRISPDDVREAEAALAEASAVVAQLEIPVETAVEAVRAAKSRGMLTILNPAPAKPIPEEVYSLIDVLTPNVRELEALAGVTIRTDEDVVNAANLLREKGVRMVVVTLGKRGAMIVDERGHRRVPTYEVPVIDTVGAGDAFNGALALALSLGADIDEAVDFANMVASIKVTKKGAQAGLPRRDEVLRFAEERGVTLNVLKLLNELRG